MLPQRGEPAFLQTREEPGISTSGANVNPQGNAQKIDRFASLFLFSIRVDKKSIMEKLYNIIIFLLRVFCIKSTCLQISPGQTR